MHAVLLLLLAVAGSSASGSEFKEEDFFCKQDILLPSTKVCDGVVDCGDSSDEKGGDDNSWLCVPSLHLQNAPYFTGSDVTCTSADLHWEEPSSSGTSPSLAILALDYYGISLVRNERRKLYERSIPKGRAALKMTGLKPLTDYTFFLRPIYTKSGRNDDPNERRWIGKAVAIDLKTLPKEFCDLSITPVTSSEVLIRWTPLEPAPMYQVTIHNDVQGEENSTFRDVRTFNVLDKPGSTYSILLDNLAPWTHYVMHLEACSEQNCTNAGEIRFLTPPHELPQPVVTEIESTHAGSIKLNWSLPSIDHDLYQGFRVRFCETNATTCLLVFTKENGYEAEGLANDTTYNVDVRAQLKLANGILKLGPPGTATVTTWTDVPVLDVSHKLDFYDQSGTSLLAWTTVNSSVTSFQYRIGGSHSWTSCKESTECNVVASGNSTEHHATGYMSITHGKKDGNVAIEVRGRNHHGCGKDYHVDFVWRGLEYPTAYHFGVPYVDDKALLRWNQHVNDGFEITGHCGNDWEIHYENRIYPYTRVHSNESVTVQGLPHSGEGCEFSVETYKEIRGLTYCSIPSEAYKSC